jgi:hypothetical protein
MSWSTMIVGEFALAVFCAVTLVRIGDLSFLTTSPSDHAASNRLEPELELELEKGISLSAQLTRAVRRA